jgi:hypothetical protein
MIHVFRLGDLVSEEELQVAYPGLSGREANSKYARRVIVAAVALADTYNRLQMKTLRSLYAVGNDATNSLNGVGDGDEGTDSLHDDVRVVGDAGPSASTNNDPNNNGPCWQMRLCLIDRTQSQEEANCVEVTLPLLTVDYARHSSSSLHE